jgi:hypothetical protein
MKAASFHRRYIAALQHSEGQVRALDLIATPEQLRRDIENQITINDNAKENTCATTET